MVLDDVGGSAIFDKLMNKLGSLFPRYETRERAAGYVKGLLSHCQRKTCWQMAEKKPFEQVKQKFAFAYDSDKLHEYTQTNQGHVLIEKRMVMQINVWLCKLMRNYPMN